MRCKVSRVPDEGDDEGYAERCLAAGRLSAINMTQSALVHRLHLP